MAKNDAIARAIAADPYLKERKAPTEAEQQLYLKEVSFSCPLCGTILRHRRQKKANKLYEIAHIFPNSPTEEQYGCLGTLPRLGDNSESFENKIALCKDCHAQQDFHTTQRVYDQNERDIARISSEIEELSSGLESGLLDVDATASEQAVYIKKLLSRARRARSKVQARWNMLDENGTYVFSSTTETFSDLQRFFPDAAVAQLEEIEDFHRTISSVFKAELRAERAKLEKELAEYDQIIREYEAQLKELIQNPKLSKVILTRHTELLREKDRMQKENDAYSKLLQLKVNRDADADRLKTIRQQQLALVSYQLNEEMSRLNDAIYEGSYNAPVLDFTETGYNFFTPDDTGTGIAYKGLVVYDLAVLGLTKLPVLVHDSVVLKQISDDAIERIIELYSSCGKQVIIALDKQDSYSEKTARLLSDSAVLRLTSNGQELFGRSWG